MHIMRGFLPPPWGEIWLALSMPVVAYGVYKMNKMIKGNRVILPLLAVLGAEIDFIDLPSSLNGHSLSIKPDFAEVKSLNRQ